MAQSDVSAFFLENNGFDTAFNYGAELEGNVPGDVINEVYGWTNETTATYTVAGTFAYNEKVTFNNSSALPAAGYGGSAGGALGLTTGWGMQLVYSQEVTLPKGTYRLCAAYYNVGTADAGNSLLAWLPGSGTATVSAVKSFPVGEWIADTLVFTVADETAGKIRIGFSALEGSGSANQAKILVDYVTLLCDEVDRGGLEAALAEAAEAYGDGSGIGAAELKAVMEKAQAVADDGGASVADILACTRDLTEATEAYWRQNASAEHPLDVTSYIVNPSFEDGTTGWENDGLFTQTNSVFPGKAGNTYVERWVNIGSQIPDVAISQTLSQVPNGKYRLGAAVGNIQQTGANSTVNAGKKQTGVVLYAGFYETPVDTMKRQKDLYFTVVDGQVTIGLRAENATGNWLCLDNFVLHYLGENTAEDYAAYLQRYSEVVRAELQERPVQASVRQVAEDALENAAGAIGGEPLDMTSLQEAKAALDEAVAAMEASAALYASLAEAMDYAAQVAGWYADDEAKHAKMQAALQAAQAAMDNAGLTDEEIQAAEADLRVVTSEVDKKSIPRNGRWGT